MIWTLTTIGLFLTLLIFIAWTGFAAKLAGAVAATGESIVFDLPAFDHVTMAKALRLTVSPDGGKAATAGTLRKVSHCPAPDCRLRPLAGHRHRQHETSRAPASILTGNDAATMMVARAPPGGLVREWQA